MKRARHTTTNENSHHKDEAMDMKGVILEDLQAYLVEEQSREWTHSELDQVQEKMHELQSVLQKVKLKKEADEKTREDTGSITKSASNTFPETGLKILVLSGFCSGKEIGTLMHLTCKYFSEILKQAGNQALLQAARQEFDFVPPTLVRAHQGDFLYKFFFNQPQEESSPLSFQTSLTADNLTIVMKIYQHDNNLEVFTKTLSSQDLISIDEHGECEYQLTQTDHGDFLNHFQFGILQTPLYVNMWAFREDTNQVAYVLRHVFPVFDEDENILFSGGALVTGPLEVQVLLELDDDADNYRMTVGNLCHPENLVGAEPDPHYTLFRAFHHYMRWLPENQEAGALHD